MASLPWVEKYRPRSLQELISHDEITSTLQKFLDGGRLPHLLLYGPPGTGKTSTALAIAKQLYSPREFGSMVLELNASDDRGIGIVRGDILQFASTRTIFTKRFKIIILDEADAMTKDAQNALRRIMEKYTNNTRFVIISNYLSKIIPALQSRCTRFRFAPLKTEQLESRIEHIAKSENVQYDAEGLKAVVSLARGDMRKALHILQACAAAHSHVDYDAVFSCVGHPTRADVECVMDALLNDSIPSAVRRIHQLQIDKGVALSDLVLEVHNFLLRIELPEEAKMDVLMKLAEMDYRLARGCSDKLQLSAFVAAFQPVRALAETRELTTTSASE